MGEFGLKPSLRFHSVGSMWTSSALAGMFFSTKATVRPVPFSEDTDDVPESSDTV